ncbi:S-layer homology domain-containing protein [Intestinibacillus sp. NTUH-41-i26]|uniref:S-layer homology domain-containing protein n=1 Tax=Butyricicoccaceae TaxID=3085642 RepID=UPI00131CAEF0|nr:MULTISPECIES: S-layer homology domain-containing protein [Butyricicoccaceae]WOC76694.1 S-layer homology domain-containing protein [Intestinibacillus sp. NTUH-41-i26]
MTRTRKLAALLLLVAVVAVSVLTAALATDNTKTYAYLPDHSVYFYDVAEGYAWAHREIDTLAMNGVVKGGGNHLFYPGNSITRADFIVMLDRAYGMSEALDSGAIAPQGSFADVPQDAYYSKAVTAAKAFGVANGTADNRFLPSRPMTREDAMVFLKRTIDRTQLDLSAGTLSGFSDAGQVAVYAADSVSALVAAKVIGGSDGRLNPKMNVTRAEMAVMLYRATHLREQGGGAAYQARGDIVNVCIGAQSYCDVVIENYDPTVHYGELMRYSKLRQENGVMYITLEENQPIDRTGVYTAGQLVLNHQAGEAAGTTAYPVAASCVAIDVSQPYHQIKSPVSTGSIYNYCYPSIVNGEVTVIYYTRP